MDYEFLCTVVVIFRLIHTWSWSPSSYEQSFLLKAGTAIILGIEK